MIQLREKQYQFTFNGLLHQYHEFHYLMFLWHEMQRDHSTKINQMKLDIIVCIYIKTILRYLMKRRRFFLRCLHCVWIHFVEQFLSVIVFKLISQIVYIFFNYFNFYPFQAFVECGLDSFYCTSIILLGISLSKLGSCQCFRPI